MKNNYNTTNDERYVISVLLSNPEKIADYPLMAVMFKNGLYGAIYNTISRLYNNNINFDLYTIMSHTANDTDFTYTQIEYQIKDILNDFVVDVNYTAHAEMIAKSYKADMLIGMLEKQEIDVANIDDTIDKISKTVDLCRKDSFKKIDTVSSLSEMFGADYFKPHEQPIDIGFSSIQVGFDKGDLIIIGARPAVGKSAFSTQCCYHWAKQGLKVAYFNLEMKEKQVLERFISLVSGIGITRLKKAENFRDNEKEVYNKALEELKALNNIYVLSGSHTVADIKSECRNIKPDIVIVDYLQLLKSNNQYRGNRYAEVGQISHDLKNLAMDMNIPVVSLCQLNRSSEMTATKEPTMSDLRESGDIEQDASIIMMLWNKSEDDKNLKGFKVEKNRQGMLSKTELKFDGNKMRFSEYNEFDKHTDESNKRKEELNDKFFMPDMEDDFEMPFL